MSNIIKCDFYRFSRNKLFYGIAAFIALIAFALTMVIRQDINIGISVFGDLTAFRGIDDIARIGIQYNNGLGIFIAILLSVFIGQEYQWKTWQHKWITNKSRAGIYLSKVVFSSIGSVIIFFVYEITTLLSSNQVQVMLTGNYTAMIICGAFIYAALGAVICLLSMLIKNNTAEVIVCLCYVLFSETLASVLSNIGNFSDTVGRIVGFGVKHSIYGMSVLVSSTGFLPEFTAVIAINSLAIIILATMFGLMMFRRYEL